MFHGVEPLYHRELVTQARREMDARYRGDIDCFRKGLMPLMLAERAGQPTVSPA